MLDRDAVETLIERKDLVDPKNPRLRKFKDTKTIVVARGKLRTVSVVENQVSDDWDIMSPDIIGAVYRKVRSKEKVVIRFVFFYLEQHHLQRHQAPPSALLTLAFAQTNV